MEERVYTINLRRGVLSSPRWKKSDDAVAFVKSFLSRHMKTKEVNIENSISAKIWKHGNQRPVGKIKIKAVKDDDGKVTATLFETVTLAKVEEKTEKESTNE